MKRKNNRKKGNTARHLLTSIKVLAGVVFTGALMLAGSSFYGHLIKMPEIQLSEVVVTGTRQADPADIQGIVRACSPECILLADLEKIKESVETLPWVSKVIVRRRLPDTLIIEVTEREAVAVAGVDNKLHIVDSQGIILDPFSDQHELLQKPIVRGLKHQISENTGQFNNIRMNAYLEVLSDFQSGGQDYAETVSEIDVTDPGHVSIIPREDPIVIYLGADSFRERYESFLTRKELYYQIKKQYGTLQYIDISFDKQIIFRTENQNISG